MVALQREPLQRSRCSQKNRGQKHPGSSPANSRRETPWAESARAEWVLQLKKGFYTGAETRTALSMDSDSD
jgi:hypothetical protein